MEKKDKDRTKRKAGEAITSNDIAGISAMALNKVLEELHIWKQVKHSPYRVEARLALALGAHRSL